MATSPSSLPPASGAWREGDAVGGRHFRDVGPVGLQLGGDLAAVRVAYESWGTLNEAADNAILICHALTGDSHVVGLAGPGHPTAGWWEGLIGPGLSLDTDRFLVVAPNVLGGCQGTTGPSSMAADGNPFGSRFPRITVGDQVAVEALLADELGIRRWAAVVGGSMGGMRALEWTVQAPERVAAALILAVGAAASADQIGTQSIQNLAITTDCNWHGGDYYDAEPGSGPHLGLSIARRIAHLTYRSEGELQGRFGNDPQGTEDPLRGGRFAIESYLDHQANKILGRFDAGSYVRLTDAMTTWDLGRGRGGTNAALRSIRVPLVVGGIDSDRLYPLGQQQQIAALAPSTVGGLRTMRSEFGHDGFLLERDQVFALVEETVTLAQHAIDAKQPS